jgi:hypothetical protein
MGLTRLSSPAMLGMVCPPLTAYLQRFATLPTACTWVGVHALVARMGGAPLKAPSNGGGGRPRIRLGHLDSPAPACPSRGTLLDGSASPSEIPSGVVCCPMGAPHVPAVNGGSPCHIDRGACRMVRGRVGARAPWDGTGGRPPFGSPSMQGVCGPASRSSP